MTATVTDALAALAELERLPTQKIPLFERFRRAATPTVAGKQIEFRRENGMVRVFFWNFYLRGEQMRTEPALPPFVLERAGRLLDRTEAEDAR